MSITAVRCWRRKMTVTQLFFHYPSTTINDYRLTILQDTAPANMRSLVTGNENVKIVFMYIFVKNALNYIKPRPN